jgi:DNA-binding transcriptional LysR family regulator
MSLTMRPSIEAALRNATIPLMPRVVTNSVHLMNLLAAENAGVAFETRIGISREEAKSELVFVPLAEPELKPQRLRLCCRPDGPLSPAATAFSKALGAAIEAYPD